MKSIDTGTKSNRFHPTLRNPFKISPWTFGLRYKDGKLDFKQKRSEKMRWLPRYNRNDIYYDVKQDNKSCLLIYFHFIWNPCEFFHVIYLINNFPYFNWIFSSLHIARIMMRMCNVCSVSLGNNQGECILQSTVSVIFSQWLPRPFSSTP